MTNTRASSIKSLAVGKAKGKDTELMKDYDMTGKNIDDEVLAFTDDLDDEEEETEKRSGEIEEEDGGDPV